MVRTPSFDKNGIKKGAWSYEEDAKLKAYISNHGHLNWRELPKFAGLKRCGKSCRLRWMNYLKPGLKHGNYTIEEDQLIIELHQQHGNKWAEIASKLPGRSDNGIKNHWHTHLKKRVGLEKPENNKSKIHKTAGLNDGIGDMHIQILESCPLKSPEIAGVSSSSMSSDMEETVDWADLMSTLLSPIDSQNANAMLAADYDYDYGEVDQDFLWREALLVSDTENYDELISSPYLNYYQDNNFELFFHNTI